MSSRCVRVLADPLLPLPVLCDSQLLRTDVSLSQPQALETRSIVEEISEGEAPFIQLLFSGAAMELIRSLGPER